MPGRAVINLESVFGLAVVLVLLWRSEPGRDTARPPKAKLDVRDAFPMILIALMIGAAYWRAAHIFFLSDDHVLVSMAQSLPVNYRGVFTHGGGDGFFRPLVDISLSWTWPWVGLDPLRWHLVSLLLHLANALLVYLLARAIGLSRSCSWLASALFAWFGANPETAVWVTGRFDLMATFFGLVALVAFIKLWEESEPRSWVWGAGAGLAMMLAIFSKESAYSIPLAMLVYAASQPSSWSRRLRFLSPFFLLAVVLFAYRWALQGGIGGYVGTGGKPQMLSLNLLSIVKVLGLRLWAVLFFPVNWTWNGAAGAQVWLGIAAALYAAAWLVLACAIKGKRERLLIPLGFVLVMALPPVQQLLIGADLEKARLVYLPAAGFCLLVATAVTMVGPSLRWGIGLTMLAFSFVALQHNLGAWESAGAKSKTVCEAAARCSNPASVEGLPRSLNGVYFFANGLPECVRLERLQYPDLPLHACSLHWDAAAGELRSQPEGVSEPRP